MRRSARALSVAALATAVLGIAVPAALAEPAAEVSPSSAAPDGSVTVSVSCDPTGGTPPGSLDAVSKAFEAGTVRLQLVSGNEDAVSGPAYSGTAKIASAQMVEEDVDTVGKDSAWTVDGTCPGAPSGQGKQWSATFTVNRGSGSQCTEPHATSCATSRPCTEPRAADGGDDCAGAAAVIQRGVHAGEGGTFTDSVPALAAGGLLIAGALGGAMYRLRRKEPATED